MFWVSQAVLALALMSPLDFVSDEYLFSAHMIQHLILAAVWPALLLMSLPSGLIEKLYHPRNLATIVRAVTFPPVAFLLFNLDLALWHIPPWYDVTLTNENVHILEHLSFMLFGLVVWWPVLNPVTRFRLSYGTQELYLFANLFPMMTLGIFFTFFQHAVYTPYIQAPRMWGISAITDQKLGGLIMWMPGNVPFGLAMLVIGVKWLDQGDLSEQAPRNTTTSESLV
jgi:cytochrome c oxidase assembly factor CtaG